MEKRDKFMGVNSIPFHKRFPGEDGCYACPAAIKREEGRVCKKCSRVSHCTGRKPRSPRCTRCKYDESPTAGTMFDKCRFSPHLAFHVAFKVSTKKKETSSPELSHEFGLRRMTCREFKKKMRQAMRGSMRYPLTGTVHADEFPAGECEEGEIGCVSDSKKRLVTAALEISERGGAGRACAKVTEYASCKEFNPFFNDCISRKTHVIADDRKGYPPLKKECPYLEQNRQGKAVIFPNFISIQ